MNKRRWGECKLCQTEKELCLSHIIPEFMYLPTYDERHRVVMIPKGKSKYEQKGIREYLLCDVCDRTVIGKRENYCSPIVKSIQDLRISRNGDQYFVSNVDYTNFKLFQLSLLWRASISSAQMFENISLEKHHEEIIRKMLLSQDPGKPNKYGCVMFVLDNVRQLQKIIWSPVKDAIDGFVCYRFLTGRIFWYFFLPEGYPKDVENFFITPEGTLRIIRAPWSEETVVKRLAGIVVKEYNSVKDGG